ncbi:HAMP domain-containing sensor histidine kinase [Clostridium sp. Ade.TY]|uniref:sensor histidine kinase n=1 Tax=Clostridium sp. Ade.TY TaxID=1391647 RepID=UPI0004084E5C|nr:HAMP domain-containing sensor histidine kinase [Clostridium sp. Ade.TY]
MINRKKKKDKEPKERKREKLKRKYEEFKETKLGIKIRELIEKFDTKIKQSIRFELMIMFAICFIISTISYGILNDMFKNVHTNAEIRYDYSDMEHSAQGIVNEIEHESISNDIKITNKDFFNNLIDRYSSDNNKIYITDIDGKVLYRNQNASEEKIDIYTVLKNVSKNPKDEYESREYTAVYPIDVDGGKFYMIYTGIPSARIEYVDYLVSNSYLALTLSIIIFIVIFLIATNKKTKYLDEIAKGIKAIADGDLSHKIPENGNDEIANIATNVNNMANEINNRIEAQEEAEKTKADLITNVSHDLRTPLTSIMGYIGLLKDKRYTDEKSMNEYLDIAYNKAEKLRILIEDLFEYTKYNNKGIKLNKVDVNLGEFVAQVSEELKPYFESSSVDQIKTLSDEPIIVSIDPDKMVRVLENLLTNAVKYSYKPGAVIIGVYSKDGYATIAVKNRGESIPKEKMDKLFDRFYRMEESRNTNLGGSGLGLAISKNIVEMHKGEIWGECYGNDISFYVRLRIK